MHSINIARPVFSTPSADSLPVKHRCSLEAEQQKGIEKNISTGDVVDDVLCKKTAHQRAVKLFLMIFPLQTRMFKVGPKDNEHPLLVAAKKELLGTDDKTTLEQVCVNFRLYSQRLHL